MAKKKSEISLSNESIELELFSEIYDKFSPIVRDAVKKPATFNSFLNVVRKIMKKNENALIGSNIVGHQVVIGKDAEDEIFKCFGLDKIDVRDTIVNSEFFVRKFGRVLKITEQICASTPLVLAAWEYTKIKKEEEAKLCYMLTFLKPYASRVSFFWKFPVNVPQMRYTIERTLNDRYDLKGCKNVLEVIKKKADVSFNNYITPENNEAKITDAKLYEICTAGISSRIQNFLNNVYTEYQKNKGKSLDFESSVMSVNDKDTDSVEYGYADIESDVAVKTRMVNKIMNSITKDPVDKKILYIACASVFGPGNGKVNMTRLESAITMVMDNMFKELPLFFSSLLNSFTTDSAGGVAHKITDLYTADFIPVAIDILTSKKSHLTNKEMIRCRTLFNKMLEEYVEKYDSSKEASSYNRLMKKAMASYWVYLIRIKSKGGA